MAKLQTQALPGNPWLLFPVWRFIPPAAILGLSDFASIAAIPFAGSLLRQTTENLQRNFCFWTLLALTTMLLTASHDGYRPQRKAALRRQTAMAINCFLAVSLAMLALAVLLGHPHILARRWTFADLLVTPFVIGAARAGLSNTLTAERAISGGPLIVCYDHCPAGLSNALQEQDVPGRISGVLYLKPGGRPAQENWTEFGDIASLLAAMQRGRVQDVVFVHHLALDTLAVTAHRELLAELISTPARIWLAFDVAANLPAFLQGRSGCRIVPVVTDELISSLNLTKRMFDLIAATMLLLLASPLLAACACLVKGSSPGPVIFRQMRTGAHGRQFAVLKFRTMADAPGQAFAQAVPQDPRVTKIGRFLRRSSLDELLQLINVIKGEMSLVGPRPHAPETEVDGITFENAVRMYRLRHRVKPGITGLAQIRGQRGETRAIDMLEQRLASDLEYIQSWSFWLDLSIMFRTLPVVLAKTNAW